MKRFAIYLSLFFEKLGFNNCFIFAILEAIKHDKYVVIRKSKHNHKCLIKLHFLVVPKDVVDKYAISYIPIKKSLGNYPCPFFSGRVKKGDK